MKKIIFALSGALALAGSAKAAVYTFEYTTKVSQITYSVDWVPVESMQAVTLPSGFTAIGDTLVGTFTYDSANAGGMSNSGGMNYSLALGSTMNFGAGSLVAGGKPQGGTIWVYDNDAYPAGDVLLVQSYFYSRDYLDRQALVVTLEDSAGSVLTGYQLPVSEIRDFNSGQFMYEFRQNDFSGEFHTYAWRVEGEITSVSLVSAVPEPGTYAMLLAGLGIVGWRRRAARLK